MSALRAETFARASKKKKERRGTKSSPRHGSSVGKRGMFSVPIAGAREKSRGREEDGTARGARKRCAELDKTVIEFLSRASRRAASWAIGWQNFFYRFLRAPSRSSSLRDDIINEVARLSPPASRS